MRIQPATPGIRHPRGTARDRIRPVTVMPQGSSAVESDTKRKEMPGARITASRVLSGKRVQTGPSVPPVTEQVKKYQAASRRNFLHSRSSRCQASRTSQPYVAGSWSVQASRTPDLLNAIQARSQLSAGWTASIPLSSECASQQRTDC